MKKWVQLFGIAAMVLVMTASTPSNSAEPDDLLLLDLKSGGRIVIEMRPDLAPKHVAQIKELTREGFYNGIVFHRVEDWVVQAGDPTGTGTSGSGQKLVAEFNDGSFVRGAVGMARTQNPNSADSQFYIIKTPSTFLDGQYTYFGKVIAGMEYVDKMPQGSPPANPPVIERATIASDAGKAVKVQ